MKAIKIWNHEINQKDTYLEFLGSFQCNNEKNVTLKISCDSIFVVFLNDKIVGFGNCSNFPKRKVFYSFNLRKYVSNKNELKIIVWHQGENFQTYINDDAYLMFEVVGSGNILLQSNKDILCRPYNCYKQNYCKMITSQLGFSYYYDFTSNTVPFEKSVEYGVGKAVSNGIKSLKLKGIKSYSIIEKEDGYLIDLKKETVGFLSFDIDSEIEQEINISYSEHLSNNKVARIIGSCDFSFEFKLKKGNNKFINTFRRIACRYLFINSKNLKINQLSLNVVEYPNKLIKTHFDDKLLQKIYDVSVKTLKCCMHEHYEDCPWREQALYALDSRNQMLCGYYAFKDYKFQKANLLLLANSIRKDGLLSICAPSGANIAIPSFSLIYPIQVYEYIEHTGDKSILKKVQKCIKKIMDTFDKNVDDNGLIPNFPYPYWNFYEWNNESSHVSDLARNKKTSYTKSYDLILNCMYVYAYKFFDKIFDTKTDLTKTINAIKKEFYIQDEHLYILDKISRKCSVLGNSLAILIGLGDEKTANKLKYDNSLIPITLSMNTFLYDALLLKDINNKDWVIEDIKQKYSKMLKKGATTFWETENPFKDFGEIGSLCHGWSAMPVYYLKKLVDK